MSLISILKSHRFFRNLATDEIEKIISFSEKRRYPKDEKIYLHDQKADQLYLLLQGSVSLRTRARQDEAKIIVSMLRGGDLFGVGPLLGSLYYTLEAYCVEESDVLCIDAEKFRNLLDANHEVGFWIMGEVAKVYFERYITILNRLQKFISQIPFVH